MVTLLKNALFFDTQRLGFLLPTSHRPSFLWRLGLCPSPDACSGRPDTRGLEDLPRDVSRGGGKAEGHPMAYGGIFGGRERRGSIDGSGKRGDRWNRGEGEWERDGVSSTNRTTRVSSNDTNRRERESFLGPYLGTFPFSSALTAAQAGGTRDKQNLRKSTEHRRYLFAPHSSAAYHDPPQERPHQGLKLT